MGSLHFLPSGVVSSFSACVSVPPDKVYQMVQQHLESVFETGESLLTERKKYHKLLDNMYKVNYTEAIFTKCYSPCYCYSKSQFDL